MDYPLEMFETTIRGETYYISEVVKEKYNESQQFRELYLLVMFTDSMDREERQFRIDRFMYSSKEEENALYDILHRERMALVALDIESIKKSDISFDYRAKK